MSIWAKLERVRRGLNQKAPDNSSDNKRRRPGGFAISRRAFIGISAVAAAALTVVLAVKRPRIFEWGEADKGTTSGVEMEQLVATSCLNCPTRCAIRVRVVNGKAVRISGNPNSTYSDGRTCPRSHVGLQVLYNPDRFRAPLERKAGAPKGRTSSFERDFQEISWDDAVEKIAQRLRGISPDKLLILQGLNTTSNEDLIRLLAGSVGAGNLFSEEGLERDADREGKSMADGRDNSGYELESPDHTATRYILAFGAGIAESERPLARNLRKWGVLRRETPNRVKVVVLEPRYSVTAAKADHWIPINPGSEGALAMAMANVIISEELYDQNFVNKWTEGFNSYRTLVMSPAFSPENVAALAGVDVGVIRETAREFARSRPAVSWSGEPATSWPYGSYASHAIYCLNALVGSIDVPGGVVYQEYPEYKPIPAISSTMEPGISLRRAEELIKNGSVELLMGFNSNLVISAPNSQEWEAALESVPYYVHIGPAMTEMAAYADIILPACTYLEEWGYDSALPGSGYAEARMKQPVIATPLHNSRSIARILFDLASRIGSPVCDPFTAITADAGGFAEEFVRYRTSDFVPWAEFRTAGVWKGADYQYRKYDEVFHTQSGRFEFDSAYLESLLNVKLPGEDTQYPLMLAVYRPVLEMRGGSQNYPWAQEVFLVMHGRGWNSFVELSAEFAREHGIRDGDKVIVESAAGTLEAEARVTEGIRRSVIAVATGQGRWASGRYAAGIGVNPNRVMVSEYDEESGQPSFFSTRVRVRKA